MALIQMTPEELQSKASSLRNSRSKHEEAMREIDALINALNEVWKGPAQDAFVEKYRGMSGKFQEFSEILEGYASLMDTAATEMRQSDETVRAKIQGFGD